MNFVILGLGAFGINLAKELAQSGHQVLVVDHDESHLDAVKELVSLAVQGNAADKNLLRELGVEKYDAAIVAVGENFEASLMMTAHLKQLGVKSIFTRVFHEVQEQLLDLMQVTGKIRVEALAADSFSRCLSNRAFLRHFVVDSTHAVVELKCPEVLIGKTLLESELRARNGLNLVTVRRSRNGDLKADDMPVIDGLPGPDFVFCQGDRLVVYGLERDISKFTKAYRQDILE
jgi:trk system potassium uptake protein